MTDESSRTSDLVELHALCARYMSYTSQFVQDRWLDVFTPDAEYDAFGPAYSLERSRAVLSRARLPAGLGDQGPRAERARWGEFSLDVGASYKQEMADDGAWGDYWLYEDRLTYVHKRHVAIPLDATPDGDVQRFDRTKMFIGA